MSSYYYHKVNYFTAHGWSESCWWETRGKNSPPSPYARK